MGSKEKAMEIASVCEERKALDVVVLDVTRITLISDYFLICHGTSGTHLDAIRDHIVQHLKAKGDRSFRVEGSRDEGWILIDAGDVLVHVFTADDRRYYDLERLWGDAEVLSLVDASG